MTPKNAVYQAPRYFGNRVTVLRKGKKLAKSLPKQYIAKHNRYRSPRFQPCAMLPMTLILGKVLSKLPAAANVRVVAIQIQNLLQENLRYPARVGNAGCR